MSKIYFNSLHIDAFRGLKNVDLNNCSLINLIVGGNNGGKTSLLEAFCLFRGSNPRNLIRIASNRTLILSSIGDFTYIFPFKENKINVSAVINDENQNYNATYSMETAIYNASADARQRYASAYIEEGTPITRFFIDVNYNNVHENLIFSSVERYVGILDLTPSFRGQESIIYVSPFSHFKLATTDVSRVLKSESYKEIFINLLKLFDDRIEDVQILDNAFSPSKNSRNIYIKLKGKDPEPLSTFGDGIKKAILLSCKIVDARNGVLLLDELETSLHHSYYEDIFAFLFKVATKYNIQIFITTHNDEVIKSLLEVDNQYFKSDLIRVYTLRKNNNDEFKIRELNGLDAYNYITYSDVELRD